MPKKLNLNKKHIINKYNSGSSTIEISKELNVHKSTISRLLKKEGIEIRSQSDACKKYNIRESFFDNINTPEKSYIIGLIYADGNFSSSRNNIEICLQENDKHILEDITKLIFIDKKPLGFREARTTTFNNKEYLCKPQYRFNITNKHISELMPSLGVVENKTFKIKYPLWLDKNFNKHFIRGYFDGDGCFSINKNTKDGIVRILGTDSLCKLIKNIIKEEIDINSNIHIKSNDIKQVVITGNVQIKKFLNWIYEESSIHLNRKYEKYEKFIST